MSLVTSKQITATVILLVTLAGVAWWLFPENAASEIRGAHRDLARLMSKSEDETSKATLLNAYALQAKFSNSCTVRGAADMFVGSYTPEEMAGTIIRVRGLFRSVDLTFHGLKIDLPAADEATVSFTARVTVQYRTEGIADASEVREVVSRMEKVEGDWRFVGFTLTKASMR